MRFNDFLAIHRRVVILAGLALFIAGCSATGGTSWQPQLKKNAADLAAEENMPRPSRPAKIGNNELGFTVTESVHISGAVREEFNQAMQLLGNGNNEAGIKLLEGVIDKAPELTTPYINIGIAYSKIGDMKNAEKSFKRALYLMPNHPVAHNELGVIYRRTGRFELARQSYERALSIYKDFHYAQLNLGVVCDLFLQDLDCALTNYQAYQQAFPDNEQVGIWIADAKNRMGNP